MYKLALLDFNEDTFRIEVLCSKGTYIRNLIEDIGTALGVGGHMTSLHRDYTAGFEGCTMHSIDTLKLASDSELMDMLLPVDFAIHWMERLSLSEEQAASIIQGQELAIEGVTEERLYRLYSAADGFLGIGTVIFPGKLRAKRLVAQS